ncbi:MAG: S8 family serine peptidase [Altibacter sp.]|uniref:S8 family serine peptidase n=1 Tax=Altibacter sp. TaxID=2024823 RepID=UPI001DCB10F4|nr:S8 family serine peptidase [Altibacter sp.]MBZ0328084.1 S8 family serine peptidase [Altibacter sp.]
MKNFILSIFLLSFFIGFGQQRTSTQVGFQKIADTTKYATAVNAIVAGYDQAKLNALYNTFSERQTSEKEEAVAYALINNIPIEKYNEDGSFDELQRITSYGAPIYYKLHNANASISTRANYLNTGGGLGLTVDGDNLTAHVWDGGPTRPTHQEFDGAGGSNRVTINDGVTTINGNSFHAQHVTGTIVASGFVAAAKGMAWQANALTHDWNNDLTEATSEASSGMLLSNHSYGFDATAIPDAWFGQYGSDARDWDLLMNSAPYYLMVNSAGNDGNDNTANGNPLAGNAAFDKLNGTATAKNNFVIANGQDASIDGSGNLISVNRNSGSSEGPTDDYRIKPDIMGNGTSLYSSLETSNSAYGNLTGTSMSAPNVTGTLLLLQEHYFDINAAFMKAATLKGLALHTADDTAALGPDAETGWGLLNAKFAAETITANPASAVISELTISQGQTYQVTIQSDGVNPLKASISWNDPAGAINSGTNSSTPALVNDLDLRLNNGSTFTPWRLTGVNSNGTGDNTVDPYERIDISGASGQYTLTVTHKGTLSGGAQDFSLVVTGGNIAASTPQISYGTTTSSLTEQTDCSYTDVTIPLNIAMAPSQDADVNFAVAGGTATDGVDFDLITTSVTFLQGQTTSQNMTVRIYHDAFVESTETAIIEFTVNPNGGDATANTNANSLTITINDNDVAPTVTQNLNILFEDFEVPTGWTSIDADGDTFDWVISNLDGIHGYVGNAARSFSWNGSNYTPNNYLMSPQFTIPAGATAASVSYEIGSATDPNFFSEHYSVYFVTDISNEAAILSSTLLVLENDRTIPAVGSETRSHNLNAVIGTPGYFVVRHHNVTGEWYLGLDTVSVDATVNTAVQTAVNNGTSDQKLLMGAGTIYTADASSGDVMLDITNNNSENYGCVDVAVTRAGTGAQPYDGSTSPNLVMDKTFAITPANTSGAGNTNVAFYFTEAEIAGWETAVGGTVGVTRNSLVIARDDNGSLVETATATLGAFGTNVTLSGTFSGLDGTYLFGPIGAFLTCPGVTKTWNGTNWSPAGAPDTTNPVIISGNYNTSAAADGNLDACTIQVDNGATLTVGADSYLNVNSNIVVNGNMVVEHTGSVVQIDTDATVTNNGGNSIDVELTTPILQTRDFMVMGSPMDGETRNGVFNSAFLVLNHTPANFIPHPGVPLGGTNFADENGDFWNAYSGNINNGEGFIVRPQSGYTDPANTTYNMTYTQGTLNNGDISRPIVFNGLASNGDGTPNVIANPYPSAISASQFIADNSLVTRIYFWEHLTPPSSSIPGAGSINFSMDDISMYIDGGALPAANDPGTSTEPNGVISTGQGFGFFAQAAGTITFTNSMRLTTGNTTLRKGVEVDKVLLKVRNEQYNVGSHALVAFNPQATPGLDENYDADRLATTISLYSHLEDGTEQLGIQSREAFDSQIKVPIGFASQVDAEVSYIISIANLEGTNIDQATIFLIDNWENSIHNLSASDYEFKSAKGTFNQRFTLLFEPEVILGTQDNSLEHIVIFPNPTSHNIQIVSPYITIEKVEVYDVQGRKIQEVVFNPQSSYQVDLSKFDAAMYFVTLYTEKGVETRSIVKE